MGIASTFRPLPRTILARKHLDASDVASRPLSQRELPGRLCCACMNTPTLIISIRIRHILYAWIGILLPTSRRWTLYALREREHVPRGPASKASPRVRRASTASTLESYLPNGSSPAAQRTHSVTAVSGTPQPSAAVAEQEGYVEGPSRQATSQVARLALTLTDAPGRFDAIAHIRCSPSVCVNRPRRAVGMTRLGTALFLLSAVFAFAGAYSPRFG